MLEPPLGPALLMQMSNDVPPSKAFLHLLIKEPFADSQDASSPDHLYQMINV